jgi:TatD DNase family protein
VIDSHCHLADPVFADDLEAVIDRAKAAGVTRALVILEAGNPKERDQADRVLRLWPDVRLAVGVHPHQAHQFAEDPERAVEVVRDQAVSMPDVRAIGEIGLDYHYDFSPRDVQRDVFRRQVRLARELRLPVVVHTREADDDTVGILKEEGGADLHGVFHCFSGTPSLAAAGLELGFFLSLAGIVTFPKAGQLRDTVHDVPVDRVLTETDSPFLSPVPFRGRRNEPAYVIRVVETLAELFGLSRADFVARTRSNFDRLFHP